MTQRQQIIFPNISFTCNGSVAKLIVGVDEIKDTGSPHETSKDKVPLAAPEVQIWRKNQSDSNSYIKIESIPLNTTQVNQSIVEIIPLFPIRVQEGDILGVYQPSHSRTGLSIKYQKHDGPINYVASNRNSALSSFSLVDRTTRRRYNYPLVTMEIIRGMLLFMN